MKVRFVKQIWLASESKIERRQGLIADGLIGAGGGRARAVASAQRGGRTKRTPVHESELRGPRFGVRRAELVGRRGEPVCVQLEVNESRRRGG